MFQIWKYYGVIGYVNFCNTISGEDSGLLGRYAVSTGNVTDVSEGRNA